MANTSNSIELKFHSRVVVVNHVEEQEGGCYRQVNTGCLEDMQEVGGQVYRVGC